MREVLIQKFPIERRAGLHAKTAKLQLIQYIAMVAL
jgi:hypothetical protein